MNLIDIVYIVILISLSYFTFFHIILWFESRTKSRPQVKTAELPKVSIIMPAYNEEKVIGQSLEKLLSIGYPKNKLEILVIDDGSTDNTYKIAKRFESRNVQVLTKKNTGKAATLNFGIKHAKYPFIAVTDADTFLERDALTKCMIEFNEPSVVAVTSHIMVKKRKTLWEKLQYTEHSIIALMRKAQEQANVINVTPGPLSVYRENVLVKLHGFDEKSIIEDVEIAWRLLRHGYKIRMAFDAMVHSIYPDTFKLWWRQRRRWVIGGLETFFKYFHTIFDRKSHGVGNWIIPTSLVGYTFAFGGTSLFAYLLVTKILNYVLYFLAAYSAGTNPLSRFEFSYNVDLTFIYGAMMFLVSLFVIRLGISLHKEKPNLLIIALFLTVYPTLLTLNLLISLYKFVKRERGWMTK